MKKVTLFILTIGLSLGMFAQQALQFGASDNLKFKTAKLHSSVSVKGATATKALGATISDIATNDTDTGFVATFTVTPSADCEKYGVVVMAAGAMDYYAQAGVPNYVFTYYEQYYAQYGYEFYQAPNGAQELSYIRLDGKTDYEVAVLEIKGDDSVSTVKQFTTPSSAKSGVASADLELVSFTDNSAVIGVTMNDQTMSFHLLFGEYDSLKANGLADEAGILAYMENYGNQYQTYNGGGNLQIGGDDAEQPLEEDVDYMVFSLAYNGNGETGKCNILVFNTTKGVGLDELINNAQVSVYPNPASERVVVASLAPISNVELINTLGQVVYSNNNMANGYNIPVSSLEKGTYFVKVRTADKVSTQKVVIK
ncbi:MAG: T9SS type A sorting domain-containing protein [Bacteroidales bacterium]|nr:T9SS type A sorting domain-containing protein [Bacteroidales bacterium]